MTADRISYRLTVNGTAHEVRDAWPHETLLHVLRFRLGLTGTKYGCELAAATVGSAITTIEGYNNPNGSLTPLQRAFVKHGALQCGYCTPGFVMSAAALIAANPELSEDDIREGMVGNLCRCTGYGRIIAAIKEAAGDGSE
ncbi:MAG: (2Fe-2S)-binding protein [Anaerolineales bacterium]|nr:(2Fe-2S)-binding protein [Anaerolineales bacterium]